jgi:hypothetical protein
MGCGDLILKVWCLFWILFPGIWSFIDRVYLTSVLLNTRRFFVAQTIRGFSE